MPVIAARRQKKRYLDGLLTCFVSAEVAFFIVRCCVTEYIAGICYKTIAESPDVGGVGRLSRASKVMKGEVIWG